MVNVKPNRPHDDYVYKDNINIDLLSQDQRIAYFEPAILSNVLHIWYTEDELAKREASERERQNEKAQIYKDAIEKIWDMLIYGNYGEEDELYAYKEFHDNVKQFIKGLDV